MVADMDALVRAIERELDVTEMVLADPLTLRRLKAERIARTVSALFSDDHLDIAARETIEHADEARFASQAWREMIDAEQFKQFPGGIR